MADAPGVEGDVTTNDPAVHMKIFFQEMESDYSLNFFVWLLALTANSKGFFLSLRVFMDGWKENAVGTETSRSKKEFKDFWKSKRKETELRLNFD